MSGRNVASANQTAAATTTTRAAIDTICSPNTDCRYETSIDGSTRYQWPSTIAVHAAPSAPAEAADLATVSACIAPDRSAATASACSTIAARPARTDAARIAARIFVNIRPIVAQYTPRIV